MAYPIKTRREEISGAMERGATGTATTTCQMSDSNATRLPAGLHNRYHVKPFVDAVEKSTPTELAINAAQGLRTVISRRVQEMINERRTASVANTKARKSAEIGAQIASLNAVLAFVASIEIEA